MKAVKVFTVLIGLILIVVFAGCTPQKRPIQQDNTTNPAKVQNPASTGGKDAYTVKQKEERNLAASIKNQVENIKQVRKASVIIIDDSAIIGINIARGPATEMTPGLKREIESTVIKSNSWVKSVTVTADPYLVDRIERIVQQTAAGKPVTAFTREIAEILRQTGPVR